MDIIKKINHNFQTSAPHVEKRLTDTPLSNAVTEIYRLRNPKLINPVENPRYDDVFEAGIRMLDDELCTEYESCFCDTDNWQPCSEKDAAIFRATGDYDIRKNKVPNAN